jgi:hypothetical protein
MEECSSSIWLRRGRNPHPNNKFSCITRWCLHQITWDFNHFLSFVPMMFRWTSLSLLSSASFPITIRAFLLPSCIHQQPNKPTGTSFCWSFVLKFRMFTLIYLIWRTFLFVRSFVKSATSYCKNSYAGVPTARMQKVCWLFSRNLATRSWSLLCIHLISCNHHGAHAGDFYDFCHDADGNTVYYRTVILKLCAPLRELVHTSSSRWIVYQVLSVLWVLAMCCTGTFSMALLVNETDAACITVWLHWNFVLHCGAYKPVVLALCTTGCVY